MSESGPAVLIVDDIEDNRYTLRRRLKRQGLENVIEAENGRAALDALYNGSFDLVLLDIMMPEMNGYEVLEAIKGDPSLRHIPVIMISAIDEMESVIRCIEGGAEDYLQKPFDATLLKARVTACLEKKRLRDMEGAFVAELEGAKKRADDLLHAILPAGAVKELVATRNVVPRRYEDVVVLFCDIVNFTPYCEAHPPERVVSDLQALIERLEALTAEHGLEKIKTIGDAFLATGNLLERLDDAVPSAIACALALVEAAPKTVPEWQIRAGIHVGPVVAGIAGHRQFLFDLWGDTVNTAARIQGRAEPGTVAISAPAWMRVRGGGFRAKSLGVLELKGKAAMEVLQCLAV